MEELIRLLSISEINHLYLDYTDSDGNFKVLELDYRKEQSDE